MLIRNIGTMKIETERLILRRFEYTDDENMLEYWVSDPAIQSMYSEPVYTTKQEVKELLNKYISAYEKDDYYRWAIVLKETGKCIGQIAYFLLDKNNHFSEIEYCIGGCFQRKGLATEATKAVIQYGFDKMNLHKVQICHKSINIASRKVIEKCGFVYEGALRDFFYMDGQYVDRLYYSILKDEFTKQVDYINEKEIDFLCRAKKSTYAGKGAETISSRPNSHDLQYAENNLKYIDTYLGGEKFIGEEAVWRDNSPFWSMNYMGRIIADGFSGDFLKECLLLVPKEYPYRGPLAYQKGDYKYHCIVNGEFEWFSGNEEMFYNDIKVYECIFHGGCIK